jgi:hypothetical protein
MKFKLIAVLLIAAQSLFAVIIPNERLYPWTGNVGVTGGVPDTSGRTVASTFSTAPTIGQVQTALNSAAANTVVQLGDYTVHWNGTIDWSGVANGVVLRGDGPANTKIIFDSFSQGAGFLMRASGSYDTSQYSKVQDLTANVVAGATTFQIASTPVWLRTGELYVIHQLEDANFVSLAGIEDTTTANTECRWCNTLSQARTCGQIVKVTGLSGSGPITVTVDAPLLYSYSTAFTAQVTPASYNTQTSTHAIGWAIEDLYTEASFSSSQTPMIWFRSVENGWLKNVYSFNSAGGAHCLAYVSYKLSVINSRFEGSHLLTSGQGYGVAWNYGTANCLVENNIFKDLHIHMSSSYGGGGHVWLYNAIYGSGDDGNIYAGIGTHGSHTFFNLWEGNYGEDKIFLDNIHGSASHQTFLRNFIQGRHASETSQLRYAVGNDRYNRTNSYVGNIFGNASINNAKEHIAPGGSDGTVWILGNTSSSQLSNDTLGHDTATTGAWLRHGNLTLFSGSSALDYDPAISDHVIPNSYYYASKPAYFNSLNWPPLDVNTLSTTNFLNIPAGYRYVNNANPPSGISTHKAVRKVGAGDGGHRK